MLYGRNTGLSIKCLEAWLEEGSKAKEELLVLRPQLDEWKQKYADEVQKRLDLIEQMSKG